MTTDNAQPVQRMVRIGITGPIGCGKSTVAGWLGERSGVTILDADDFARDVLAPGTAELGAVLSRFGGGLARDDGSLDRAALAGIVFADPSALRDLEAIVHPAVRVRILAALGAAEARRDRAIVIEAIKLVEGGLAELCDEVWLVVCDPSAQLRRLLGRGSDADDAQARIAAQGDLAARLTPRATRIVDTSGGLDATRETVDAAVADALSRTA